MTSKFLAKNLFSRHDETIFKRFTISYSMPQLFYFCSFFIWFLLPFYSLCAEKPLILVSVAPHQFFVEKIAGDSVTVQLIVPSGASSHTYEPTPRQMITASQAAIWFIIGEPFEVRAIQALKSHRPNLQIVNLQKNLDLIESSHVHGKKGCCAGHVDLHFWLSAREAQTQAQTIAESLSRLFPENQDLYEKNLLLFQKELSDLDYEILTILKKLKNRNILVSHPAYGYFCRDYNLVQHSIEVEGKDPTPQQMTKLLNDARRLNSKIIYIQLQYNNKAAKLVAETLKLKLITLDPYAYDYLETMRTIAHAFAEG